MRSYLDKFELKTTFENGQCFRWNKDGDYYIGVAYGEVVKLKELDDVIEIVTSGDRPLDFWKHYFFLDEVASIIDSKIATIDDNIREALEFGRGMKMLRQEPFETLLSFITSSNNNIQRIKSLVENLSANYGDAIEFEGTMYYAFPRPEQLKNTSVSDLRELGFGYRDKYIYDAVHKVLNGDVLLDTLYEKNREGVLEELLKIKGVGKKVASCIALFAYSKYNAFPVDVWIKKVIATMYVKESKKYENIDVFIDEYFGEYSGVAQQYLFYYARENKI